MGDITKTFDNHLHKAWNNLIESLQTYKPLNAADGGRAGSIFDQARSKQAVEQIQKSTHAMHGFFKHSTMMDFGDGSGVYAIQVVKANPHMKATVLDLEAYARWLNNISRAMLEDKAFRLFQGRHSKWL